MSHYDINNDISVHVYSEPQPCGICRGWHPLSACPGLRTWLPATAGSVQIPFKCPMCEGYGTVPASMIGIIDHNMHECPTCKGERILWQYGTFTF